ncbi:MAG: tetratricopeptide repeat protein [Oligoflexales bacterium]
MKWVCLLVDVDQSGLVQTWKDQIAGLKFGLTVQYASPSEAELLIEAGNVASLIFFMNQATQAPTIAPIIEAFRKKIGNLSSFMAVVCSNPQPDFLAALFEFGIENLVAMEDWATEACRMVDDVATVLSDNESLESKVVTLYQNLERGDQAAINQAAKNIEDYRQLNHLAAYAIGDAMQSIGNFGQAIESYQKSSSLNGLFRPAASKLGETFLVIGKIQEAIDVLENLEKSNPKDVERKAILAAAYSEKGDYTTAEKLLGEARSLGAENPKVYEAEAHLLLAQGKANDAFKLLSKLSEVGPFFATKLNEMGIKLSQANKGKSALALYQKAHKIVKRELRYKVSLNAALACYRMADFTQALAYIDRCELEYGGTLEKATKIRAACKANLNANKQAG